MSAWTNQSALASHALASGLDVETEDKYLSEVIHEQVKAELEKAMADFPLRREIDYMRQQHELLRQEFQAYRSAQKVVAPPSAHDTGSPALRKLEKDFAVLQIAIEDWQMKDQKEFADLQMKLEEWQVKGRLSCLAVGMLAIQASKLADAEREAVLNSLEKEEKDLTTGLKRFPSADAEDQAAFEGSARSPVPQAKPLAGKNSPSPSHVSTTSSSSRGQMQSNQVGHDARNSARPNSDWWRSGHDARNSARPNSDWWRSKMFGTSI